MCLLAGFLAAQSFRGKQSLFAALEKCPNYCFCVKLDAAAAAAAC